MKRLSVLSLCAVALLVNACEKHPASRLPDEHATAFGAHGGGHGGEHGPKGQAHSEHDSAAKPEKSEKPGATPEAKPGEAPKFFPEKK